MRINEKHLVHFASNSSPADKEGFLHKRGEVNKAYQKRWFILKGNLLFYYEKRTDLREPIGVIVLEGCTIELAENAESYTFELVFPGAASRVYVLSADSQEEMESWMKALARANYDYMRLMVSVLQRDLDEMNLDQQAAAVSSENQSKSTSKDSTDLLVDLNTNKTINRGSGHSTRSNPFNLMPAQTSDQTGHCRTFKQMHEDFGRLILEKLNESAVKSKPLIDI